MAGNAQVLKEIRELRDGIEKAQTRLSTYVAAVFPVGCELNWMYGPHMQEGHVVAPTSGSGYSCDRIRVRNNITGKSYIVTVFDVMLALEVVDRRRKP